ncbi:MAG: pilus assembly protein PilP [Deltaproteobacteria bacterium]|nr:pilus assembly protein PilP [Deltaproteobacteria bacterium]
MMTAPNRRFMLLWMLLVAALVFGCGDGSQSQAPKKPAGLRKKIAADSGLAVRSASPKAASKRGQAHPSKKGAALPAMTPAAPEKKDVAQPKKSDFLALAEGLIRQPEYYYDPRGKHDPFESPFGTEAQHVGIAPVKKRAERKRMPLTPLQRISLGQLKLVAVVLCPKGNKALVEEPSGKGYVISKGTYIGENYQRVKQILSDRIIIEGEVEDFITGSTKVQTTELKLQKKVGD